MKYYIDKNKCTLCAKCLNDCPKKCIDINNKNITDKCNGCGICYNICAYRAIRKSGEENEV